MSGIAPEISPPTTAPAIDGGAIQANRRQLMRPARMWAIAAAKAATPEMPMLAPAPAAGEAATSSTAGRRMLPSTRPTAPPANATAKHQPHSSASSSASIAAKSARPASENRYQFDNVRARCPSAAPPSRCSRSSSLCSRVAATAVGGGDAPVSAVATTTQVADLVRNVGGPRVDVDGILPANADPHDYEPRPSDAAALARADVVFRSGGDVDGWLDDVVDSAGGDAEQVTLIDSARPLERDGEADPHWWQDPRNAIAAATRIRDALIAADPDGRRGYERRAAAYTAELRRLDSEVAHCIREVPPRSGASSPPTTRSATLRVATASR